MSVYSGFATRQQENRYNDCISALLALLSKRLLKFYSHASVQEQRFRQHLAALHDRMNRMEKNKYMQPHYSEIIRSLLVALDGVQYEQYPPLDDFQVNPLGLEHHIYCDQSIPVTKITKWRKSSKHRIQINSMQGLEQQPVPLFDQESSRKQSEVTLKETQSRFKSRHRTLTPEKKQIPNFYTPPQKKSGDNEDIEHELPTFHKEGVFRLKQKPKERNLGLRIPTLERPVKTESQPLSPRQFLRQTMMGKPQGGSFVGLRTKQKHQKLVK